MDQGFERSAPPSRRRAGRTDVVTHQVRVELTGTSPPLWRRLELASDMRLDELHDVLQVAFGWTDSHLHRFGAGPTFDSHETEYYLSPFEVEEGEVGIPEHEVRLDQVLVDPRDTLLYLYDFGDGWEHTVALEAVRERAGSAPRAVCTDGGRPGPVEDCGGVSGYELCCAAADATHPDHEAALAELAEMAGADVDPSSVAPTPFDIDVINAQLATLGRPPAEDVPEPLGELVRAVQDSRERIRLQRLITTAMAGEPPTIDADGAARMVRPYSWLLDRVGQDGIALTAAGYLPPAHVEAAMVAAGLADHWLGPMNRESNTPVLLLRESAQQAGLLRRYRGKLLLTPRARRLRADPVGLWWHLAGVLPPGPRDSCQHQAGLLLLIGIAAGATGDLYAGVARTLHAIGWARQDGTPLTGRDAAEAAWDTATVLRRSGGLAGAYRGRAERPTADGVTFARAALRSS
jgi:pRiA4b ORF-3-like protein